MRLPGNGWPVCGSLITKLVPEKSPARIDWLGTMACAPPPSALSRPPS